MYGLPGLGLELIFFRSLREGLSRAVLSYSSGRRAASRTVPENVMDFPAFDSYRWWVMMRRRERQSDLLTLTLLSFLEARRIGIVPKADTLYSIVRCRCDSWMGELSDPSHSLTTGHKLHRLKLRAVPVQQTTWTMLERASF